MILYNLSLILAVSLPLLSHGLARWSSSEACMDLDAERMTTRERTKEKARSIKSDTKESQRRL